MKTLLIFSLTGFFVLFFSNATCQTWSNAGSGIPDNGRIQSMCVYNGDLYVGGYFDSIGGLPVNSIAKWNGYNWDTLPGVSGFGDIEIFDMTVYNNELIIAGNLDQIHKWDGSAWSVLEGLIDNRQFAVEVYNEDLFITGHFKNIGGIPTGGIARWDGNEWDSLGEAGLHLPAGFTGSALEEYDGELYLAGGFSSVGGLSVHSIASWDGSSWDSVGIIDELSDFHSLCKYNNKLYAGGYMQINNSTNHWISSWDGMEWDSAGFGLNHVPVTMAVYDNELYVGGRFDTAGQNQALGIARWNDMSWNGVGSGLDSLNVSPESVYCMCVYNNDLYVGGYFTSIGGISANSIARWNSGNLSVNPSYFLHEIDIHPNPVRDLLNISINNQNTNNYIVKIFDLKSQIIDIIESKKRNLTIDVSGYRKGVYLICVTIDGCLYRNKMIKL